MGQSAFEIGRNIVPLQPAVKCGLRLFKQMNGFRKNRPQRSRKCQSLSRGIEGCGERNRDLLLVKLELDARRSKPAVPFSPEMVKDQG